MSSFIYNSCIYNVFRSMIHFDTDMFKMFLVTSNYLPSKDHEKRSDILDEIPNAGGYVRGGVEVGISIEKDVENSRTNIVLGEAIWSNVTITAAGAIYYRVGFNDLVCFVEFDKEASSVNGGFRVTSSTLVVQN